MDYNEIIKYKIETLIDLMLTDGASPSDLSDNIFENNYTKISYYKKNDFIIGELEFYDDIRQDKVVKMIYTYTLERRIIRIEEKMGNITKVLWDRHSRENELINEILSYMKEVYTDKQIINFINTLPEKLKHRLHSEMVFSA